MENTNTNKYDITPQGSLGLLALGDVGLREWRKAKNEIFKAAQKEGNINE